MRKVEECDCVEGLIVSWNDTAFIKKGSDKPDVDDETHVTEFEYCPFCGIRCDDYV
jgi:hypothetical protein